MAKVIAPSDNLGERSYTGLSVYESARLLRRYQQVERACMKVALAWLLAAPKYEDKYAIGYHLWDHAEHVQWIRTRLEELRGGNVDAAVEPLLKVALDESLHARDIAELAAGLYLGLKQALLNAYRTHLSLADSAANAAESRLLARMIPDLERQIAWAEGVLQRPELDRQSANRWQVYILARLDQAGGISGMGYNVSAGSSQRPHSFRMLRPDHMIFDGRIQSGPLASYQSREELPIEEAVREQFKVFFNEWWAAGLLATILFDAWDSDAPWEFFYELSHHCWDEVRHSEFGAIRLKELGDEPRNVDMTLFSQAVNWPFLHRLIYLTLDMEVYFMARKRPRVLRYQEEHENRSLIFADADWSDEINHVRYGKRWSDFLLKDDMRTVDDIKQEIAALIERQNQQARGETKSPF
jgi:hypothetical protein